MTLFTIIIQDESEDIAMEQVLALDPKEALISWAKNININAWPGIGVKIKELIISNLTDKNNACIAVENKKNVWCTSTLIRGKLFIFDIIKTAEDSIHSNNDFPKRLIL